MREERAYLEARAKTERRMAALATDPAVAEVHLELAAAYERRLRDDIALRVDRKGGQPASANVIPISRTLAPPA